MELRTIHNKVKKSWIEQNVKKGDTVLDCGCGRGGDWHKWKHVGAVVTGVDPDPMSLLEASSRAINISLEVILQQGDIRGVRNGPFDVVCYNFSLHYIFETDSLFTESIDALVRNVKPGGKLIGITPDEARIAEYLGPDASSRSDGQGNTITRNGSVLSVHVADGPFYADGPKTEPILCKDRLVAALQGHFKLVSWEPMIGNPTSLISDIYSKFIFIRL
jgi:SAM-dependent methyltransferase